MALVRGLHHLTMSVGSAQEDYDFHTGVLGLYNVKKTALYDGKVPIYHLYYANRRGDASTVLTTFPFVNPLLAKAIPFITKGFRSESDVVEAAKHVDDSTFSEVPWDVTSFVSNATASVLALSGTSEMLFARNLKQTLLPIAQSAVITHVAQNSTMASLFRGVAWGEPFISPFGKACRMNTVSQVCR